MLSSQADRLRAWANQLSERDDLGPVRFAAASDLREAARTILELSGRLTHWELHECPGCKNVADLQEALDENDRLRAENAKLRELCKVLLWGTDHDLPPAEALLWSDKVNRLARELGIEVE